VTKDSTGLPFQEKIYPNLLTNSIAKDLEAGKDPLELILVHNSGWLLEECSERMPDDASRQGKDRTYHLHFLHRLVARKCLLYQVRR
jgi:hypothetical protein